MDDKEKFLKHFPKIHVSAMPWSALKIFNFLTKNHSIYNALNTKSQQEFEKELSDNRQKNQLYNYKYIVKSVEFSAF